MKARTAVTAKPLSPPPSEMRTAVAERIRDWRKRQGMTQSDLADRAGISFSYLSMLERAERSPSWETLFELARSLDIPIPELLRSERDPAVDDGYFRVLIDFARGAHLSRRQVEQLVAVGRTLFAIPEAADSRAAQKQPAAGRLCSVPECGRLLVSKGLCSRHYQQSLRRKVG